MLVYQATKREFMDDVEADAIADAITAAFERKLHRANPAEVTSWRNSGVSPCPTPMPVC